MVVTPSDVAWLSTHYPSLAVDEDLKEVKGEISFSAAYDQTSDSFTILRAVGATAPGTSLQGVYKVKIVDIQDPDPLRLLLPRTYIDDPDFPRSLDRHFSGEAACLCGPSEEAAIIRSGYSFPSYLEELVIPFLYAQTHYDAHQRWPWSEYAHGIIGVLDSYENNGDLNAIPITLIYLKGRPDWPAIKTMLQSKAFPKGHMPCWCAKADLIRRCHPSAWEGLKKLYADVQRSGIDLSSW